ncbi:ABC transporter ATP-binding protein [Streptococcus mutans]|uniref:ABC transporter ATP-binding protein n=1 Tax=Streptococcus mutans TaxID=1309 RepID=UPI0002B58F3A|nr:ABC transporter ATP-binding protein [Streptococcus mutans]EMB67324.1 putative ABC transporter ATP-binding protein [Streptococcus mutans 2ST1]EMB73592.1 putative ABC transporter ATP-binding protein [Streptococcus mutans 15VF2]EMC36736.1 putative ABC transporter ATP-binding protein [Streptococcus mutans 21]MCB4976819.1 ABC transporter ATP-binding protein/permease [Streptococcus mutans]
MESLLIYFKGYLKETILGPVFKLLEASFELLVPLVIAKMVDRYIPHNDKNHLYLMIFFLVLLACSNITVALIAQYCSAKAAVGYTKQLSQSLFQKIMRLPKEKRDELTTSSLVTRLVSDTFQIQTGINQFLRLFLRAPIIVFGSVLMAFLISPRITIWFFLMVFVLFALVYLMSVVVNPLYDKIRRLTDKIVGLTREQLEGSRVIRAFGQIKAEEENFQKTNQDYTDWQIKTGYISTLITPLTYLAVNVTLIVVIWQGQIAISHHYLSQGMLIALVNYLLQILVELLKLTMLVSSLNQSFISARRITQVFDQEEEDVLAPLQSQLVSDDVLVKVTDMTFSYPQAAKSALERISFAVGQGEFFGIIGGTGSGKSSLIQVLLRLYLPQKGNVAIFKDKRSAKTIKEWRNWVSLVPQKAELFTGTIRSNLLLSTEKKVSDEQLWQVLDIAQASDFVNQKPGKLDAQVEAFGRNFSGGQRQRLTIARALLKEAPLLILDDATSALDYLTEAKLLQAIKDNFKKTTLIMVSQRTNSLSKADNILVLDQGKQVALADHAKLLQTCSLYQEIHYSQHPQEEVVK